MKEFLEKRRQTVKLDSKFEFSGNDLSEVVQSQVNQIQKQRPVSPVL